MAPVDYKCCLDYLEKYREDSENLYAIQYNYNYRQIRAIIAKSKMCITMKHHPIIFAMGEKTPTISLALSKYYKHKNVGALKLFKQEKYNVVLSDNDYLEKFDYLLEDLIQNSDNIPFKIDESYDDLIVRKEKFIKKVKELLK